MRWKTYCRLEERDRRLIAAWCGGVGETIDRLRSQGAKPSRIAQRSHAAGLAAGRALNYRRISRNWSVVVRKVYMRGFRPSHFPLALRIRSCRTGPQIGEREQTLQQYAVDSSVM
jgi:hypothetical protein